MHSFNRLVANAYMIRLRYAQHTLSLSLTCPSPSHSSTLLPPALPAPDTSTSKASHLAHMPLARVVRSLAAPTHPLLRGPTRGSAGSQTRAGSQRHSWRPQRPVRASRRSGPASPACAESESRSRHRARPATCERTREGMRVNSQTVELCGEVLTSERSQGHARMRAHATLAMLCARGSRIHPALLHTCAAKMPVCVHKRVRICMAVSEVAGGLHE